MEEKAKEEAFVDQKVIKTLKHEVIKRREKRFKKERTCIYPNCVEKSIVRSHTIQKSKSLKFIADDNHVLQPIFNEKSNKIEMHMNKVGINDASTFPGFCPKHEKLFTEFENAGHISTIEHGQLQSYRSICREIVFNENELDSVKYSLRRYLEIRNKNALDYIDNKIVSKLKGVELEYDDAFVTSQKKSINYIEQKLVVLKKYHDSLLNTFQANQKIDDIFTKAIEIDICLPIALCGIASVGVEENGTQRTACCILNVIPGDKSTTIIIAGLMIDKGILEPYWEYYTQNNISIINLIESFMIHGTDNWFINPSIWNKINNEKQKIILNEVLASEKSFLDQFELSIFDDIRVAFITQLEKQQKWMYQKNIEDLVNFEKKKFIIDNYKSTRNAVEVLLDIFNRIEVNE